MAVLTLDKLESDLSRTELELLRELVRALRGVRYGSVSLTVHDGQLVEIQKIEKIRLPKQADRNP